MENENLKIEKAILNNSFLRLKFAEQSASGALAYNNWVHPDLEKAFSMLNIHLALICEQVEEMRSLSQDDEEHAKTPSIQKFNERNNAIFAGIKCNEFTIIGANEGVKLAGTRLLASEEMIKLATYNLSWSGIDRDNYYYRHNLAECLEACKSEIEQFLEGKHGVPPDEDSDSDNNDADKLDGLFGEKVGINTIQGTEKPKPKGRPKKEKTVESSNEETD